MMWRRLLIIVAAGAALLLLAERFGPGGVQRRGMKAAKSFGQSLAPTLAADPRFSAVETTVTTHPGLRVHGEVPDRQALMDLERVTRPPPNAAFRVFMHAEVGDDSGTRPAAPPG